jgi:uncharacterized protein
MKHKILFKAIVGSQAYGTNTPESDVDIKGIYIQSNDEILSNRYKEQINVTKDECYYEIQRFLQLAKSANPTILELLYTPDDCILETSPEFELLKQNRDKFLTKKCYNSFSGYAYQQIQKATGLDKKMNYEKEKITQKSIIDFCYINLHSGKVFKLNEFIEDFDMIKENIGLVKLDHFKDIYALYYDDSGQIGYRCLVKENSTQLRCSIVAKNQNPFCILYFNSQEYSKYCKEYKEYNEWLKNRNTARYVDVEAHGQKIDGKNLLHCRRLIDVALEIPILKTINVRRENAEYLLSIRKGKVSLEEVLEKAKKDIESLKDIYLNSDLPDDIDDDFVSDLLLQIRKMQNE